MSGSNKIVSLACFRANDWAQHTKLQTQEKMKRNNRRKITETLKNSSWKGLQLSSSSGLSSKQGQLYGLLWTLSRFLLSSRMEISHPLACPVLVSPSSNFP